MQTEPKPPLNFVTVAELAATMGRSREGVRKAINRLGIKPAATTRTITLYDPAIAPVLEEAMRAPNTTAA